MSKQNRDERKIEKDSKEEQKEEVSKRKFMMMLGTRDEIHDDSS